MTMNQTLIIAIIAVVAFLVLTKIILWRLLKRQFGPQAPASQTPASQTQAPQTKAPQVAKHHDDVISAGATAVEDVLAPVLGEMHAGPADDLTRIKGLGPKAAAQLKLLGITRFSQLAALDGAQTAVVDENMGVFRGRLERDRWSEQARYLARGDIRSFEEEFGKLG